MNHLLELELLVLVPEYSHAVELTFQLASLLLGQAIPSKEYGLKH
jgi:hypothetical protein